MQIMAPPRVALATRRLMRKGAMGKAKPATKAMTKYDRINYRMKMNFTFKKKKTCLLNMFNKSTNFQKNETLLMH